MQGEEWRSRPEVQSKVSLDCKIIAYLWVLFGVGVLALVAVGTTWGGASAGRVEARRPADVWPQLAVSTL